MTTHRPDDELLTIKEAARVFRLDASTIRRWIKTGQIPAIELPHSQKRTVYRIRRRVIDALLVERNTSP